jgi:transcriptional regulator with XRE-family HTH domain
VDPHQVFASNLRTVRQRKKLSQEELAVRSGLHRTEISLLERAGRDPRLATILRLARALEVPISRLTRAVDDAALPPRGKDQR